MLKTQDKVTQFSNLQNTPLEDKIIKDILLLKEDILNL